jgi:CBS domain containing-hemolysin-like protein
MFHVCYLALIASLLLIALFAASEAALAATNRVRLRHLLRMQTTPDDYHTTHLLSSDLSTDAQSFIATVTIAANIPLLIAAGTVVWLAWHLYGRQPLVALLCTVIALLTVALFQIAPRLLVSQPGEGHAGERTRLWWVRPARILVALLHPPVSLLLAAGKLLLRPFGLMDAPRRVSLNEGDEAEDEIHAEQIRDLMESAQASGVLEAGGKELIESIFTFGDTRVHEVMIPRPDILALPVDAEPGVVLDTFQETGFSRVPLFEENIDRIVGILHVKDVLACLSQQNWDFAPRQLMRAPIFLPEAQKIDEALSTMRTQRTHIAIAIDEFGGTAGLLTVEDVLEELVGEIADEHDRKIEDPLTILDDHTALADALLHTEDLEELWDLVLPTAEFDTVGGFVIEQLGRAPVVGDRVTLSNVELVVHSVRGRRPQKIMIIRKPNPE